MICKLTIFFILPKARRHIIYNMSPFPALIAAI